MHEDGTQDQRQEKERIMPRHRSHLQTGKARVWMNIWMMILIWVVSGCQMCPRADRRDQGEWK